MPQAPNGPAPQARVLRVRPKGVMCTLENVEKLLEDIRTINPELRAVSFLNRADPVGSDNQDSREILSEVSGIEFSSITIVNRKAFGKAVSSGLSVIELGISDAKATREIAALYEYIFGAKIA